MNVSVRLFARVRDLAGADRVAVELPDGATVGDLRRALAVVHPAMAAIIGRCAVAVDAEFAEDARSLAPCQEIALLPPVSGG
jgi:molybdopterin converting factor subunit 1